ncbi:solute carrier organic anion transporter family member 5A1-like [Haliotis rufescens]|uniref:solute carrier organic anion transporter family member 5A1-like n=1 Tax=Haliotis rufescens TaxID=6454 RepID=UPI00201F9044|nr:solute carrier organic anion transporter family member 5A1-like [Haliotis rufescens]
MAGLNMRAISLLVFGSKYMEHVFNVPIWQSSMFIGIGVMLLSGVGCFLGGAVVSHFKMGRRGCLLFATGAMVLSTVSEGINMTMGCPNTRIAGLNLQLNGTLNTIACQCDGTDFLPVCGNDVTFFSPCHPGCQNSTGISYGGCAGVEGGAVVLGMCDTDCFKLYPFMALTVVYAVVGSFSIVPSYLVLIRSVSERDRTMAASIYGLAISLLAYIPGPVLYGKIIDTTCIVWRNLCGKRGACALYDIVEWRMKMAGTNVGLLVMSTLFAVLAYCVLTYKGRPAVAKSV